MKHLIFVASALIAIFLSIGFAARPQTSPPSQRPISRAPVDQSQATASKALDQLFNEDQSDSRPYNTPQQRQESDARARRRIDRVSQIVSKGQLQSGDDYYHAAMVFQHGSKPEDFLMAHVLATVAGFKGHSWGTWLSAASLDAYLLSIEQSQILGTIYGKDNFSRYHRILNDVIRRQYCVPPLAIQMTNEEFIEKRVGHFQRRAKECGE